MKILITGVAGFIGFSLAKKLLEMNYKVYGVDNLDQYYSKKYKNLRLNYLNKISKFKFKKLDLSNRKKTFNYLKNKKFDYIFHFAAQAGVRYTAQNPKKYVETNIYGYLNILDSIKTKPKILFYASSSSVYGEQKSLPVSEKAKQNPINIYASTKFLNEIISQFYSKIFKTNIIGLRFFTVYGEWGRPDMFLFKLFKSFFTKKFFYLNNSGNHKRDFTYIGDVVEILIKLMKKKNYGDLKNYQINVCSNSPVSIKTIIKYFLKNYGTTKIKNIKRNNLDIKDTHGENYKLKSLINYSKFTSAEEGLKKTFEWYKKYKIYFY